MMRTLIFVLVFLVHLQLIASLTPPEKAVKDFVMVFWKYRSLRDTDIYHRDFKYIDSNGNDATEKILQYWKSDERVQFSAEKYKEGLKKNNFWSNFFRGHTARFVDEDKLLEEEEFINNKLTSKWLMIPDSNVEGGYKLLKVVEY
ncbi:unnamed protein product [Caenorhabditis angaria]|uniref:Mos1 transposase HTH domain-containing protein n=1 Tax=Caenorhabditis angaria TaxID=860376 RepID=A0A9P1IDY3_9PELO|nr:unnamed protein product [Caenorhabditis angaria]